MRTCNLDLSCLAGVLLSGLVILAGGLAGRAFGVEIVAHRGASYSAPENTLASVRLAWQRNADAVEIDVYLTADGRIVALHDATTKRTTGKDWKVADRTLAELKTLDAGVWKGAAWAGEKIPTLQEILATVPDGKRLFIEIKCGPQILPELERVLKASGKQPAQTVVISFDLATVRAVKGTMPLLPVYWIRPTSPRRDKKTGQIVDRLDDLIETCRKSGLDGLDLAHDSQLTKELIARIHGLGLEMHVWTVNSPDDARKLIALGVDGITTDRPGWLREQLQTAE